MPQRWTITTHHTGTPRDIDIYLYDRTRDLRAAATKWARTTARHAAPEFSDTLAICHGFQYIKINPDGTEEEHPRAAIIRYSLEHLTTEVIAHELVHAAQHLYGLDCIPAGDQAADHFDAANETFAHLYSDLLVTALAILPKVN